MARTFGIMAYGEAADRDRLEALARLNNQSSSKWLIEAIREKYREIYGDAPPPPSTKEKAKS